MGLVTFASHLLQHHPDLVFQLGIIHLSDASFGIKHVYRTHRKLPNAAAHQVTQATFNEVASSSVFHKPLGHDETDASRFVSCTDILV